jgi:hypothetical protein
MARLNAWLARNGFNPRSEKNSRVISPAIFVAGLRAFREDFIENTELVKIEATNVLCWEAISLIEKHSINATDAVVLRSALDLAATEQKHGNDLILVTADQRLITAAKAEGLPVINPEIATLAEIEKLLQPESPPAPSAA